MIRTTIKILPVKIGDTEIDELFVYFKDKQESNIRKAYWVCVDEGIVVCKCATQTLLGARRKKEQLPGSFIIEVLTGRTFGY